MDQPNPTAPVTHEHLHNHTNKLTLLILVAIVVLAAGEFYLYRQVMHVKQMVSEGNMQIKEEIKPTPAEEAPEDVTTTPSETPIVTTTPSASPSLSPSPSAAVQQ